MKKTIRMSVDRQEGSILVLIPDEGAKEVHLDKAEFPLSVGDVADVTLEDDTVLSVVRCEEEKKARESDYSARLAALFSKGKKPER
jgi:hypothetical protein